jgi:hypothetical protein
MSYRDPSELRRCKLSHVMSSAVCLKLVSFFRVPHLGSLRHALLVGVHAVPQSRRHPSPATEPAEYAGIEYAALPVAPRSVVQRASGTYSEAPSYIRRDIGAPVIVCRVHIGDGGDTVGRHRG